MRATEQAEQHLAELRNRRTAVAAEIEALAPELARAAAALVEASAVFNEALRQRLALEQDGGVTLRMTDAADVEVLPAASGTRTFERPKGVEQEQRLQERRAAAYGTWQQADDELGAARVRYNDLQLRRSGLLMHGRVLDDRIAQAEAELERARQQPSERDLLANIRERLGMGAA
jgi:chromosome segregation ATPase